MASSVATPLERQFGHIAGVTEMTSASSLGTTSITIQFDLSRDIDGAARDVEAAINAARTYLPANLPSNPTYRKVNPADSPIMILGLTSDKFGPDKLYDEASTVIAAEVVADPGRGAGHGGRRRAALRSRGRKSHAIGQLWADHGEFAVRAEPPELGPGERPNLGRHRDRRHSCQRPDLASRGLQAAHRWLSTTAPPCACPMSPTSLTPCKTSALPAI